VKYALLLSILFLFAGCETTQKHLGPPKYTKLTVTDVDGSFIAEWIAEGKVSKSDEGYDVTAVERRSGPPFPTYNRYPNGRATTVAGPNIVLETVPKPDWLHRMDGDLEGGLVVQNLDPELAKQMKRDQQKIRNW
jgi:hypothetical protein